ncbi:MAG TPA: hypothetical protein VFW77_05325 [Candidatus Saccharimonadales bacterium]|nr:hypothetical protein [Candidatus Saccharimonadales bacterium]
MGRYSRGFAIVETMLIVIILAILAGVVYFVYRSNHNASDSLKNLDNSAIIEGESKDKAKKNTITEPTMPATHEVTVTPSGGSELKLSVPSAWTLVEGDNGKIENTIGSYKYTIAFQITDMDYLKLGAYKSDKVLAQTTDKSGQAIYIVKTYQNIELSACKPSDGKGCSLMQDGRSLFVFVSTPGQQAPGTIDFSDSSVDTLINDLKTIATSLSI